MSYILNVFNMIIRGNASKTLENIFCVIVNVNFMIENEIQIERSVKIIKHLLCGKKLFGILINVLMRLMNI